jgi:hypothetical protein
MRKHASGLQIGALAIDGLVALYLLGGAAAYADAWHGTHLTFFLPDAVQSALVRHYQEILIPLKLWPVAPW